MNRSIALYVLLSLAALGLASTSPTSLAAQAPRQYAARSAGGMAAASTPSATRAAVSVLEQGGNAIDAAAAALLALMVTDPANTSLGGRVQILIALRDGRLVGIDGATQSPARVRPLSGESDTRAGYAIAPVPGAPAALAAMVAEHGKLRLADVMRPAIALARDGFTVTPRLALGWTRTSAVLRRDAGAAEHFLKGDGSPYGPGDLFRQPKLAEVLEQIARDGVAAFYKGAIAEAIARDMARKGGFIALDDLRAYRPLAAPIVRTTYRGFEVAALGGRAWGDTLVEMLNILEEFPAGSEPRGREVEILARTMHQALTDRPQELGTLKPKPGGYTLATLSSREFARGRAAAIRQALEGGTVPAGIQQEREWHDTTHVSVMDAEGNAVAVTTSIGPAFGSGVATPGLGFLYGHSYRMRADPTPGARDETEMTPTIILRGGKPVLAVGAAGSERIPTAILQVINQVIDHGAPLDRAVAEPRLFSIGRAVRLETGFDPAIAAALRTRGFDVQPSETPLGTVHAVQVLDGSREFIGAADPRYDGNASGPTAPPRR